MALPYQEFAFLLGIYYYTIKLQVKLSWLQKTCFRLDLPLVEVKQRAFKDRLGVLHLRACKLGKEIN